MRLTIGTPAPVLVADTLDGRRVKLAALRGRTVHLKFYRFATCPVCSLHLHHFINDYRLVEALGLTTFVVFHSPAAKLEASRRDEVPFDLIPDPDKESVGVRTGRGPIFRQAVFGGQGGLVCGACFCSRRWRPWRRGTPAA